MVANPVLVSHLIFKTESHIRQDINGFENRQAVCSTTAEIINLANARVLEEL